MTTDTVLRLISFVASCIGMPVLALSITVRLKADPRVLTRGQLRGQLSLGLLMFGVAWGVGEGLWHLPHYRLYIFAVASVFAVVGVSGMLGDALDERKHRRPTVDQ